MVFRGAIWIDEGFYFQAASDAARGLLPYRDVFYHRLPLLPALYGPLVAVSGHSLLAGRALSALLCAGTAFLVWRTCNKLLNPWAGLLGAAMLILNPWAIYYFSTFSGYALEALLITAAFSRLLTDPDSAMSWVVATVLLGCVVLERYPLDYMVIVAGSVLAVAWIRSDHLNRRRIVGATLVAGGLLLVFWFAAPRAAQTVWYDTFTFNRDQWSNQEEFGVLPKTMSLSYELVARVRTEARVLRIFLAPILLMVAGLVAWGLQRGERGGRAVIGASGRAVLLAGASFVLANEAFYALFLTNSPVQRLYGLPVAVIVGSVAVGEVWRQTTDVRAKRLIGALAVLVVCFTAVAQEAPPLRTRGKSEPAFLADIGKAVARLTSPDQVVLSFNSTIPPVAARTGVKGLEMGYYTFAPSWSESKAREHGTLNVSMLEEMIRQRAAGAIVLDSALFFDEIHMGAMLNPYRKEIVGLVHQNYVLARRFIADQGQFPGTTEIYVPAQRVH